MPWLVLSMASASVLAVSLEVTGLYAAFRALREAVPSASAGDLSRELNAWPVTCAALLVAAGRYADLRGRRRAFVTGLAVFLVA